MMTKELVPNQASLEYFSKYLQNHKHSVTDIQTCELSALGYLLDLFINCCFLIALNHLTRKFCRETYGSCWVSERKTHFVVKFSSPLF